MNFKPRSLRLMSVLAAILAVLAYLSVTYGPDYLGNQAIKRGQAAALGGDYHNAMLDMTAATAYFPDRIDLWEQGGQYAYLAEDHATSVEFFERAQSLGVLSASAYVQFGDAFLMLDDPKSAVTIWNSALNEYGPSVEIYTRLLEIHQKDVDYPAMMDDLQALTKLQPGNAEYYYQIGLLSAAISPDDALAPLAQAAELEQTYLEVASLLERTIRSARLVEDEPAYIFTEVGRVLGNLGEWELALEAFSNATEAHPNYAEAWAFLSESQQQLGLEGEGAIERAYSLNPDSVAVNTFYAFYWQRLGRYDLALDSLEEAIALDPDNPFLMLEMGSVLSSLGEIQSAIDLLQQAIQIAPENPLYWQILASVSIENEAQVQEIALPAARQALLLGESDPVSLDLLGQVYLLLSDFLLAERFLLKAQIADPKFAPAYYHLGKMYFFDGDEEQARTQLQRVLEIAPNTPVAEQAEQFLLDFLP